MNEILSDWANWVGVLAGLCAFGFIFYDIYLERKCARLEDKVEGLEADLENAVEAAFNRGAEEWTKLNYPTLYLKFKGDKATARDMADHLDKKKRNELLREDAERINESERLKAPWSQELVNDLNAGQNDPYRHPYTCPGDHPQCANHRNLIATPNGWVCVCGKYKQDWATDESWRL